MTIDRRPLLKLAGVLLAFGVLPAQANDRTVVEAFYTELLNASGPKDKPAVAAKLLANNWQSIGDYSGKNKSRDELAKQIGGFHMLMPDLTWKIEEVIQSGNVFVVRGRATGTPKGPLFGVDGKGKGFTIMSIDIHKVEAGKIVTSHHVEDWAGALRQLSAQ